MSSFSDSFLSGANWWLGWIAIVGTSLGLLSAVATHIARREISQRQSAKDAIKEERLAEAERRVVEQTAKLAGSAEKLAAAQAEAAKARELAEKLKEQASPRHLSPAQITAIKTAIDGVPSGTRIDLGFRGDDPEGFDFSMQIVDMLTQANFDVHWNSMMLVTIPKGIHVNTGYSNEALIPIIRRALDAAQLRYTYGTVSGRQNEPPMTNLLLLIGSKP